MKGRKRVVVRESKERVRNPGEWGKFCDELKQLFVLRPL